MFPMCETSSKIDDKRNTRRKIYRTIQRTNNDRMNELYDAIEKKEVSRIAEYFQHKRTPSAGWDALLWVSSPVAEEALSHLAVTFRTRDFHVLLCSPTAFEAPWKAIFNTIQYFLRSDDTNDKDHSLSNDSEQQEEEVEEVVLLIQSFLQQVAAEWKAQETIRQKPKPKSRKSMDRPTTTDHPRVWMERYVRDIFASSSSSHDQNNGNPNTAVSMNKHAVQFFPVVSTLCSLAQQANDAFYHEMVETVVSYPNRNHHSVNETSANLLAWMKVLQPHVDATFDTPQWISFLQTLQSTLLSSHNNNNDIPTNHLVLLFRSLLSFYRMACRHQNNESDPSLFGQDIGEDRIWHTLLLSLYQRIHLRMTATTTTTAHSVQECHGCLQSCLTTLPTNLLIKWLHWTLDASNTTRTTNHGTVPIIATAIAIFQAWHWGNHSRTQEPTTINLGPMFWETMSNFVFGVPRRKRRRRTEKQLAYAQSVESLQSVLGETKCQYRGKGKFGFTENDSSLDWLQEAGVLIFDTLQFLTTTDANAGNLLIDSVFDTMGCYFQSARGYDLLLWVLVLVVLGELREPCRLLILSRVRRCFLRQDDQEGLLRCCCYILDLLGHSDDGNHDDIWRCVSQILRRDLSSVVFQDLCRATARSPSAQSAMLQLGENFIARPVSTAFFAISHKQQSTIGSFEKALHILRVLCTTGLPMVRKHALELLGSLLDGSKLVHFYFHQKVCVAVCDMVKEEAIDPAFLEVIFQRVVAALVKSFDEYGKQKILDQSKPDSWKHLEKSFHLARVCSMILSKAKNINENGILLESMWPYDTLLDSLFWAFLEWYGLKNASRSPKTTEQRRLDVGNNDAYVGAAISTLSALYRITLDSTHILEVTGAPTLKLLIEMTGESCINTSKPSLLCMADDSTLIDIARCDIIDLLLRDEVLKDKPSTHYKAFLLAVSYAVESSHIQIGEVIGTSKTGIMLECLCIAFKSVSLKELVLERSTAEEIDQILYLVLKICTWLRSDDSKSNGPAMQVLVKLYDSFCSEEKVADMLLHLENSTTFRPQNKNCRVLDLTGRSQLESSVRKYRVAILQAMSKVLENSSIERMIELERADIEAITAHILKLCKDLKMGLLCASGGIDTDLCVAFLGCVENSACLLAGGSLENDPEQSSRIVFSIEQSLCCIGEILDSISLTNADVVNAVLSLTLNTLPTVVSNIFDESCFSGVSSASQGVKAICEIRNAMVTMCLQYNHRRLAPLEQVQISNLSGLLGAVSDSKKYAHSMSIDKSLPSKMSSLFESDKTWEWAFATVLQSHRDTLYHIESKVQDPSSFRALESGLLCLAEWSLTQSQTIIHNGVRLFEPAPTKKSSKALRSGLVTTFPVSIKDWLCAFLGQFCSTLQVSIASVKNLLVCDISELKTPGHVHAFCFLVGWLEIDDDLCQQARAWLDWEERIMSRANSKNSVVAVAADSSLIKDLVKLVDDAENTVDELQSLWDYAKQLNDFSPVTNHSTMWGEMQTFAKQLCGASFSLKERLRQRCELLQSLTWSKSNKSTKEKAPAKRKKRKASSETVVRNRNQVVEEWLNKDKETDEGKLGDDTFADLEDFLVED